MPLICPKFIYRKAPNFGDHVVRKIIVLLGKQKVHFERKGFFPCTKCISCRTVKTSDKGHTTICTNDGGNTFTIDEFITCNASHLVYLFWCLCDLYYVWRTKRPLKKCIAVHVANIRKGCRQHSVSLHFRNAYNRDPTVLQFCGIDRVYSTWRGSNSK